MDGKKDSINACINFKKSKVVILIQKNELQNKECYQ